MSYSCVDFVDDVLNTLNINVPLEHADNPQGQAELALAEIARLQRAAELESLVAMLARMDTPTDGVTDQEKAADIMADLDDERLCSDVAALYEVIRKARGLMANR